MLESLATLCGVVCDEAKSENNSISMIVLGMSVEWCKSFDHVRVSLEREKAVQWMQELQRALDIGILDEHFAAKMAGRSQW